MDPYDHAATWLAPDTHARIAAFWQDFAAVADRLDAGFSGSAPEAVAQSVHVMDALKGVSPDLMWEFGPSDRGHCLCITAEWRDSLRPLARLVRQMAPDLPRWRFSDTRAPHEEAVAETFAARFGQPLRLSRIEATLGSTGRIDLVGHGTGSADDLFRQTLSVASLILGEAVDRDWIGSIEGAPQKAGLFGFLKAAPAQFDAAGFRAGFAKALSQARAALPDQPYADWPIDARPVTLAKVSGLPDTHRRSDLFLVNTSNETHSQAVLSGGRFASPCYSRHGEWFLYLRLARTAETPFDLVDDRYALETALHAALAGDGTGGWVAGSTGRDAVYIDLAVTDVGRALDRVANVIAGQPNALQATVHFLDSGLEDLVHPAVPERRMVH